MAKTSPPLRRDAERNRQLVLTAARALIAERGLDVSKEEIARAAGVGMGTVYRRFPDERDLIEALFTDHVDAVVALAEDAGRDPDPLHGLRRFIEGSLEMQAEDRGLRELLRGARKDSEQVLRARELITPIVSDLVGRAQDAGQLAADITSGDFELVELMVTGMMDAAGPADADLWRRALALAFAGLRDRGPLPGVSPDAETIDRLHAGRPDYINH